MAVATLERPTENTANEAEHNAAIRENYLRLINPENGIEDIIGGTPARSEKAPAAEIASRSYASYGTMSRGNVDGGAYDTPYMRPPVQLASASVTTSGESYPAPGAIDESDVFRADNPMYKKYFDENRNVLFPKEGYQVEKEEYHVAEENVDERPTDNTIRYRSIGTTGVYEKAADDVSSSNEEKAGSRFHFGIEIGKRERTIIGTFIGIVVALFVLVIVNSVIISGLNKDIDAASEDVQAAQARYEQTSDSLTAAMDGENVYNYALENGMTYVGTNR